MNKFRILVADDDQDDYDLLVSVFLELGLTHDFVHVTNGVQLIDALEHCTDDSILLPDLILLDINMPRMDGMQALGIIRSRPHLSPVSVLVCSTCGNSDLVEKCLGAGANGFVIKECSMKGIKAFAMGINDFLNNKTKMPGQQFMDPVMKSNS